jgi:hypothetical protein
MLSTASEITSFLPGDTLSSLCHHFLNATTAQHPYVSIVADSDDKYQSSLLQCVRYLLSYVWELGSGLSVLHYWGTSQGPDL